MAMSSLMMESQLTLKGECNSFGLKLHLFQYFMKIYTYKGLTDLLIFEYFCHTFSYTFVQYSVSKNVLSATVSGTVSTIIMT